MVLNIVVTQHIFEISCESEKVDFLENTLFPELQMSGGAAFIFTKTNQAAAEGFKLSSNFGSPVVCLHGDMDRQDCDRPLREFKDGEATVLVTTDAA